MAFIEKVRNAFSPFVKWWNGTTAVDRHLLPSGMVYTKLNVGGYLSEAVAGDTRKLSALKTEMRASDGHLDGEIAKIEAWIREAPIDVLPVPEKLNKFSLKGTAEARLAVEIADYVRDQLLDPDLDIRGALNHFLWGEFDGLGPLQVLTRIEGAGLNGAGKRRWEKLVELEPIPPERFRWNLEGVTSLWVQPTDDPNYVIPAAELGAALAYHQAEPWVPSPHRRGIMRRCLLPWLAKRYAIEWWSRYVELFGVPYRKGTYPSGSDEMRQKLEAALRLSGSAPYGAFPEGSDIEFISGATGGAIHPDLIEYCDETQSKAIMGSTQTSDISANAGSVASSTVHLDVAQSRAHSLGIKVCDRFRRTVIRGLIDRVYGPEIGALHTPKITLRVKGYDDLAMFAAALQTLDTLGYSSKIPTAWIAERTGIPIPEDGEETLADIKPEPPELGEGGEIGENEKGPKKISDFKAPKEKK